MKPTAQRANRLSSAVGASLKGVFLGGEGYDFSTNNRYNVQKHALILLKDAKLWRESASTSCSL